MVEEIFIATANSPVTSAVFMKESNINWVSFNIVEKIRTIKAGIENLNISFLSTVGFFEIINNLNYRGT